MKILELEYEREVVGLGGWGRSLFGLNILEQSLKGFRYLLVLALLNGLRIVP